jgi:hypothetical protein
MTLLGSRGIPGDRYINQRKERCGNLHFYRGGAGMSIEETTKAIPFFKPEMASSNMGR